MKTYVKVASIWLVNILILGAIYVLIIKLDLAFRRDPSFASISVDQSVGCVGATHSAIFASSSLLVIDHELSGLSLSQINDIDTLVSSIMGVAKSTSVVWWEKAENLNYLTHFMLVNSKLGGATRGGIAWNGCVFHELWGQSTDLSYIDMQYDWAWTVASFLHERAHSYRAVHGKAGALFDGPVDFVNVVGPMDAYWWTSVGTTAIESTCNKSTDVLFTTTCKRVQLILNISSE